MLGDLPADVFFWVLGDLQAEPILGAGRPTSQYRFKSVARQTSITFVPRLWVLGDLQANIVQRDGRQTQPTNTTVQVQLSHSE